MSRFWSPLLNQLTPYVPGEQLAVPHLVKLNTNENPYGPSPRALQAIADAAGDALRLYPDPHATALRTAIAQRHDLALSQVFVGNGSDEVLAHVFQALLNHGQPVLFPDVSYSFYPVYCKLYGIQARTVPLNERFEIEVAGYGGACGGVIIANPNAPTGLALPLADIERLLQLQPDRVVVIDEAYVDFGGESAVRLLGRHPNLLVVQTMSKSRGLAGLRVGYAMGSAELVQGLERVKESFNSYPVDRLAMAGATASFADEAWFEHTRQAVMRTRSALSTSLRELGFEVLPSSTNFVFARHPGFDAGWLAQGLKQRAILVRHFRLPRIEQFLRITVGTDEDCAALLAALRDLTATPASIQAA
ncbi:histidinol-phosphate transaminase [Aquabacterium soli]|uniref:Histidinol-phosphate aminotransferase n=1 Tax=Aquabacterium soli TaxID=2493092 RepID=A0A3R8S747_9BURK|nr:histidinol-phosphate transaminase [Aquabacterium soli]RRS03007.1 histidinol-phosphate transaminase [Aquabacterium soli]